MREAQLTDRKRVAFIRPGPCPLANTKAEEEIRRQFHEYDVDVIDLKALVKKHPDVILINGIYTLILYGFDLIFGNKRLREAFWHTPYIFHTVKRLVTRQLSKSKYLFTFQMQSLFDCSLPHVPHFVYTDHTHLANLNYNDFDSKRLFSDKWIDLEKQIYNNATSTFVRSTNIQQSLIRQYRYPSERAVCVYAGNNVDIRSVITQSKIYTHENILYVGLDWKRKGGPELVNAFRSILAEYPNASLTIVGATPNLDIPNCTVIGKIPPEELAHYYEDATIFCMPTHVEPFGIVFLEAMQARLPIVGTRVGAIPDFIEDGWNGYLVEPGDVQGIVKALSDLLHDPDQRRKFGERGFALAKERYSWESVGKRIYQHIYATLQ